MTNDQFLAFASIEELHDLLAQRKLSPVDLTELFLQRMERANPKLNAILTITAEEALTAARHAEKQFMRSRKSGNSDRPLLGIPITLKDNIMTKGVRTTAGSTILHDFVPAQDATVAHKLRKAGAILLGKTNMHEFAYGITSDNPHYGPARNPWATERISGGSSGGSAVAVAAGLCVASVGTDTGGSIRVPSALCGIVGLKPTFGRVSAFGVVPLAPSFDHVGPLARNVCDAAILLGLLSGRDASDPTTARQPVADYRIALRRPLRKFRLGRPQEHYWDRLDPEIRKGAESAIREMEKQGATVRQVSLPSLTAGIAAATDISLVEARYGHEVAGYWPARASEYTEEVRQRLDSGGNVAGVTFLKALAMQKQVRAEFDAALQQVDAIVAPSVPIPAPPIGAEFVEIDGVKTGVRPALVGMSRPANLTGHPAISVPCGFTRENLPFGLQLIGAYFRETTLLQIAFAYERHHQWSTRHPKF